MSVEWITYKNKKILVTIYSGLSQEEMVKAIREQADIVGKSNDKVLLLDDFTDSFAGEEFMNVAKELGKTIVGPKTEKNAIIGVTGIKKVLLNAYNVFTKYPAVPFPTKQEALDFLVKD